MDQARLFAVLKYEITGFKDASKLRKSETMTVSYKIGRLGFCHVCKYVYIALWGSCLVILGIGWVLILEAASKLLRKCHIQIFTV